MDFEDASDGPVTMDRLKYDVGSEADLAPAKQKLQECSSVHSTAGDLEAKANIERSGGRTTL